ncbi:hypothetical protein BDZ94DRAFT_1157451 [Collybia nuda]|uniref:S-adenosyl-L-methionine-dependent methyltransferase n=1 Tax=Collybia nuda TaxID=64659 RepID=A0A9P6CI13_9AGAR|nr:hypothetical protein BDZ94DRAFT_1157451 [Collybia nuda]
MKLSAAFSILLDLRVGIQAALLPTLRAIMASPSLIFRPAALSRSFMANLWISFGKGVDENGRAVKIQLITPHAHGVVLDIGAGSHGHTVKYLDHDRVSKYIALEPNVLMHPQLREVANAAGFRESDRSLLILSCGAEDTESILSSIGSHGNQPTVDTIISILTFCTIPSPESTIKSLVNEVLKPGGELLFYEHVLSPKDDVAWWQTFWTPLWTRFFDGCVLDRPTHIWIDNLLSGENRNSVWHERNIWGKEGEPEENLFWHRVGRFVKN